VKIQWETELLENDFVALCVPFIDDGNHILNPTLTGDYIFHFVKVESTGEAMDIKPDVEPDVIDQKPIIKPEPIDIKPEPIDIKPEPIDIKPEPMDIKPNTSGSLKRKAATEDFGNVAVKRER